MKPQPFSSFQRPQRQHQGRTLSPRPYYQRGDHVGAADKTATPRPTTTKQPLALPGLQDCRAPSRPLLFESAAKPSQNNLEEGVTMKSVQEGKAQERQGHYSAAYVNITTEIGFTNAEEDRIKRSFPKSANATIETPYKEGNLQIPHTSGNIHDLTHLGQHPDLIHPGQHPDLVHLGQHLGPRQRPDLQRLGHPDLQHLGQIGQQSQPHLHLRLQHPRRQAKLKPFDLFGSLCP